MIGDVRKKNTSSLGLLVALGLLATAICFGAKAYQKSGGKLLPTTSMGVNISVNGTYFYLDMNTDGVWFDPQWMTTEYPAVFTAAEYEGLEVIVDGTPLPSNGTIEVPITEIAKNVGIPVVVTNKQSDITRTFYIRTLHIAMPELEFYINGTQDGYYYTSVDYCLYKIDQNGKIVYYRDSQTGLNFDFKRTEIGDKIYYSFLKQSNPDASPNKLSKGFFNWCRAYIMDERYQVIDEVQTLVPNKQVPINSALDNHELMVLGDRHYMFIGYVGKRVDNIPEDIPHSQTGVRVVATVLQEIKNGELVWQWDSTDHPELYGMSVEGNDYYNTVCQWSDYTHGNSIEIDPVDNNLICSFRNLDAVLKIDRQSGEILWVLGGKADQFGLSEKEKFSRQHFARLTGNGTLTLFDNATNSIFCGYPEEYTGPATGQTRVLEMKLDEANKRLLDYKEYSVEGQYSPAMGSASRTSNKSDTFLICWGYRGTPNALVSEIDFSTNKVLFEAVYSGSYFNAYRTYKFDR